MIWFLIFYLFKVSGTSASTYDGGSKCFLDYVFIPRGGVSTQASNRNNQGTNNSFTI